MKKKYQFFISSTYADLIDERLEIIQTILRTENIPLGMEAFPAADKKQMDLIRGIIDQSDFYIVLVGGRYGSIDPESGKSYTELEYDYAVSRGIPILAFLKTDDSITKDKMDTEPKKQEKLEAFKTKLKEKLLKFWSSKHELAAAVSQAIMLVLKDNPPGGLIKYDEMPEILELTQKNEFEKKYNEEILNCMNQVESIEFLNRKGKDSFSEILKYFMACYNDVDTFLKLVKYSSSQFMENITSIPRKFDSKALDFQHLNTYQYNLLNLPKQVVRPRLFHYSRSDKVQILKIELAYLISYYGLSRFTLLSKILKEHYDNQFVRDLLYFLSVRNQNEYEWRSYIEELLINPMVVDIYSKNFSINTSSYYYNGFGSQIENFFSHTYNLYVKLDEDETAEEEKIGLIYKLRNSFSPEMQEILFVHSLSKVGRKWCYESEKNMKTGKRYNFISRYELIKNVRKNDLANINFLHFYPLIKYDFEN